MSSKKAYPLVASAMLTALGILLPFLTAQIPVVGKMLCPMHIPVLLCGFLCGPIRGAAVGLLTPLLRFLLVGTPPVPSCFYMAAELAVYGFLTGFFWRKFPRRRAFCYLSLLIAMMAGRLVNGLLHLTILGVTGGTYPLKTFLAANVLDSWLGILLQILLIPPLVGVLAPFSSERQIPSEKRGKEPPQGETYDTEQK